MTDSKTTNNAERNKKGINEWWKKNKTAVLKEAKASEHPDRFIKEVVINKIPFSFRHEKANGGTNFMRFSTGDFIKLK